ncbi:MAG TPA: NAD(P)/FAD-dependent oxidoreductase [Acidobacteriota bacterium]|nr:NAD(P)/FAD-dependent oxidoreductase [Acidobacteriota bacterium]
MLALQNAPQLEDVLNSGEQPTVSEVADTLWDVIIVGAGPAGSMTAMSLAAYDHSVLLVDRAYFPRYKVCGCCLNLAAIRTLEQAGLWGLVDEGRARPLDSVDLFAFGRHAKLSLPGGFAISRTALDSALIDSALRRGVTFLPGARAEFEAADATGCRIRFRTVQEAGSIQARVVVCADGLGGSFLKNHPRFKPITAKNSRVGLGCIYPDSIPGLRGGAIRMCIGSKGYVGTVQLEDGTFDIAAALDPEAIGKEGTSPADAINSILSQSGVPEIPELAVQDWKGTPRLTRHRPSLGDERIFVVGDAAGYVEPFTGEGIAWALMSASLVAPLVRDAIVRWTPNLLAEWHEIRGSHIRHRQRVCRVVCRALRSPLICQVLLPLLSRRPCWAGPVITMLNESIDRKALKL